MSVEYPVVPSLPKSPFYSAVAVIPPGGTWVLVGGQNAVGPSGEIVGTDVATQAAQVRENLEAALRAAGCDWGNVVRVTVVLKEGVDARAGFAVFAPVLMARPAPPLVLSFTVAGLARPEFLLEVGLEAVR